MGIESIVTIAIVAGCSMLLTALLAWLWSRLKMQRERDQWASDAEVQQALTQAQCRDPSAGSRRSDATAAGCATTA